MAKCSRCKEWEDIDGRDEDVVVCPDCLRKEVSALKEKLVSNLSVYQKEMFEDFCNLIRFDSRI